MKIKKISVIIPCFNEAFFIAATLTKVYNSKIGNLKKEIIVVDDGSNDGSTHIIEKNIKRIPNLIFLRHKKNRGKGAAIKTGLNIATGDIIIIQDADGEYDPRQYRKLITPFLISGAQ